jgi:Tol biopolymer transport system component
MVEESPDGKSIFYTRREGTGPLFNLTLGGGSERQVEKCVFSRALASTPSGLYYIGCADGPQAPLYRLDIASGQRRHVGQLERGQGVVMGLTISADGKTILYGREVPWSSDLMMIENFR